jgi:hypothetical protein
MEHHPVFLTPLQRIGSHMRFDGEEKASRRIEGAAALAKDAPDHEKRM